MSEKAFKAWEKVSYGMIHPVVSDNKNVGGVMKKKVVKEEIYMAISAQAKLKECLSIFGNARALVFNEQEEAVNKIAEAYRTTEAAIEALQEIYEVKE